MRSARLTAGVAAIWCLTSIACQPRSAPGDGTTSRADTAGTAPGPIPRVDSAARSDSGSASVELRTDKSRYRLNEQMTMTLENRSGSSYVFNPCTRVLERQTETGWKAEREDRICTMEGWILDPRGTRTGKTEFSETLPAGTYRAVIALTREGAGTGNSSERAVSAPFTLDR